MFLDEPMSLDDFVARVVEVGVGSGVVAAVEI
jgi:hypothetical protein